MGAVFTTSGVLFATFKILPYPTRLLLQTFIILPVIFITSLICTFIGGIIKYFSFNLIPTPFKIYLLQHLYESFAEVLLFAMESWTNLRYVISGDDVSNDSNCILLANHSASLFDFIPLGSIADHLNQVSKSFVFIKQEMMRFPVMGWVESVCPHAVGLSRNWETDKIAIKELCNRFNANIDYKLVTPWMWYIFPEGTRFSEEKLIKAQKFAKERGYECYNHLLQPRVKGFSFLTKHLHQTLGVIVDASIVYFDKPATPKDVFLRTRFCDYIHVHFRVYKNKEIPKEIEQLNEWLRDRWTEKEEIIAKMKNKQIKCRPMNRSLSRPIKYYLFYVNAIHLFINLLFGISFWSTYSLVMLTCAIFPVIIVFVEHLVDTDEMFSFN